MTLEEVRKEIDAIDQQLLPLFLKRMDCAKQGRHNRQCAS